MAATAHNPDQSAPDTPPAVENPESWGLGTGTVPTVSRFIKALDERLINTLQETVVNVNGIFLQVCKQHNKILLAIGVKSEPYRCVSVGQRTYKVGFGILPM